MIRFIILIAYVLIISGCSSVQYQEYNSSLYVGYKETRIDESGFQVSYYEKREVPESLLRAYLARRASELCKGDFKITDISMMIMIASGRKPIEREFIKGTVLCFKGHK